jgi:hypothetical protein
VDRSDVRTLLRADDCPPEYRVLKASEAAPEEIADARRGWFSIVGTRVHLTPPVDWHLDPNSSVAFQGAFARLSWLDVLFDAYRRQGDRGALRDALSLGLDWSRQNELGDSDLPRKAWVDKVAGDRAPYLAYLARAAACERMLSGRQARTLLRSLEAHGRFLSDPDVYRPTNHGLFVDFGLKLMSEQVPFLGGAPRWRALAVDRFEETLRSRVFADEGLWLEHSANYQLAMTRLVEKFIDSGAPDSDLPRLAALMSDVGGWLIEPDGAIVMLGDATLQHPEAAFLESAADDQGMLWLPRSGLAVVKEQGAFLSLAAGFHNASHNHGDTLSFDLYDRGHRIVNDTGLYHKDPDAWYAFSQSSGAHSVLEVDGEPFELGGQFAYGSGLTARGTSGGWYAIQGTNPLLVPAGVRHTRLLLYRPGTALVVVDLARSESEHVYRRHFQLGPDVEVSRSGGELALAADGLSGRLTSTASAESETLALVNGQSDPLGGFVFPAFRQAVPRWTATFETRGSDVDHAATFSLDPDRRVQAELVGQATPNRTELVLEDGTATPERVVVTREADALAVDSAP